jgi:hypothetical protein
MYTIMHIAEVKVNNTLVLAFVAEGLGRKVTNRGRSPINQIFSIALRAPGGATTRNPVTHKAAGGFSVCGIRCCPASADFLKMLLYMHI